jgi:hypothetical protein
MSVFSLIHEGICEILLQKISAEMAILLSPKQYGCMTPAKLNL